MFYQMKLYNFLYNSLHMYLIKQTWNLSMFSIQILNIMNIFYLCMHYIQISLQNIKQDILKHKFYCRGIIPYLCSRHNLNRLIHLSNLHKEINKENIYQIINCYNILLNILLSMYFLINKELLIKDYILCRYLVNPYKFSKVSCNPHINLLHQIILRE